MEKAGDSSYSGPMGCCKFVFRFTFYLMYVSMLSAGMCICAPCACLMPEVRGGGSDLSEVELKRTVSLHKVLLAEWGSLQELQVLLTLNHISRPHCLF